MPQKAQVVVPSSQRQMKYFSNEVQDKVRTSYKNQYGGSSSNVTKSYKAQEFVDKRAGQLGFKQEAKYTFTKRFVDKKQGFTIEYETQLKLIEYKTTATKSNNNRIGYY